MRAESTDLKIQIAGESYTAHSATIQYSLGGLAHATLEISPPGDPRKTSDETEVFQLFRKLRSIILNKRDVGNNASVEMHVGALQQRFEGILSGLGGNAQISENSGGTRIRVTVVDRLQLLNSLNFAVYQDNPRIETSVNFPVADSTVAEARNPQGGLDARILALLEAKIRMSERVPQSTLHPSIVVAREHNSKLLPLFTELLSSNSDRLNPVWLAEMNIVDSTKLNEWLSRQLFNNTNGFRAVLDIMEQLQMVFTSARPGTRTGLFRALSFEDTGIPLGTGVLGRVETNMGNSQSVPVGQVNVHPGRRLPEINVVANDRWRMDNIIKPLAVFPDEPYPWGGESISIQLPPFFQHRTTPDVHTGTLPTKTYTSPGEIPSIAAEIDGVRTDNNVPASEVNSSGLPELALEWARQVWITRAYADSSISLDLAFENSQAHVSDTVDWNGFRGILKTITHTLSINGNSGDASTRYKISHAVPI